MADRAGIEIDYCPTCRGVWLDRGELDKIIERTSVAAPAPAAPTPVSPGGLPVPAGYPTDARPQQPPPPRRYRDDDDDDDDDRRRSDWERDGRYRDDGYRPKKRKSILGEIFDF
jgi:Zn-finger nucleic acid-binding protein